MKRKILILAAALAATCPAARATAVFDAPGGGITCLGDVDIDPHPDYGVFCTVVGRTKLPATKTLPRPLPTPQTRNTANRA